MTPLPQGTALPLEVGGAHVVEHQRAVFQMPFGQFLLDLRLARPQPVHRGVEGLGMGLTVTHAIFAATGKRVRKLPVKAGPTAFYVVRQAELSATPASDPETASRFVRADPGCVAQDRRGADSEPTRG